jgi:hypothetical protein
MKLLLDECVVQEFRRQLAGHDVFTVGYVGWSGVKNGRLLELAAADGYDALITTDKSIPFQQDASALPLAVVVLRAASNDLDDLMPLVPRLLAALASMSRNSVTYY